MGYMRTNQSELNQLLFSPSGQVMSELRDVGNAVRNEAVRRVRRDTGASAASITVIQDVDHGVIRTRIGSSLHYFIYQELGTGIYGPKKRRITPVQARALRFKPGRARAALPRGKRGTSPEKRGGWVFAASVKGTPPTHALTDALKIVSPWPVHDFSGSAGSAL